MTEAFRRLEKEEVSEAEVIEFGTGKLRLAAQEGDMIHGSIMAGQSSGLVCEVLPARELIQSLMDQTQAAITHLAGLAA